jgi:hypothetical protein
MLTVANDALLEPESSAIDPHQLVGALDTLRRLAFVDFRPVAPEARAAVTSAVRNRVGAWLASLREQTSLRSVGLACPNAAILCTSAESRSFLTSISHST